MKSTKAALLMVVFTFYTGSVLADTLPERLEKFISMFRTDDAVVSYDIRKIETDYPTKLITPESMLPQTSNYPLKDIQQLYALSLTCRGTIPLSPLITEPLVFVRALCKGTTLHPRWFIRSGLIHPGGGTYAARYVEKNPEMYPSLKQFMHIKERPKADKDTLLGRLQNLDDKSVMALITGASMFLDQKELWLRKGDKYYIYPDELWQAYAKSSGLEYTMATLTDSCLLERGNICWQQHTDKDSLKYVMGALIAINILLIIGWSYYRWNHKRQELKSRMLVLQILTHELRTPIASLSLTVEGFRREFEKLPESVYDEFRRLCEDSRRLRQLAEASKDYLQSDNQQLAAEWVSSVEEWLAFKVEGEFENEVAFSINEDVAAKLNVYWLGTCIDNLLRNALKYGVKPVKLDVYTEVNKVTFKVIDEGSLTHKDWRQLRKPFVSKSGLGLGLTIVESMVGRMGGTMSLIGPPTTFILEIPCETDIASR